MGSPSTELPALTPLESWLIQNHYAHDTSVDTPSDKTGVPLLISYASNNTPDEYAPMVPSLADNNLVFPFYDGRDDVIYTLEISKDLTEWTSSGVTLSEPDDDGVRFASFNLSNGRCFVRLRFERESEF